MKVLHNSQLAVYREPFGAAPCGSAVRLAFDVWEEDEPEAGPGEWLTKAQLRLWRDGLGEELLEMQPLPLPQADGRRFAAKINLPEEGGLVWYYFLLHLADGRLLFYGNNAQGLGGEGCLQTEQPPSFQITVYRPQPAERQPRWFANHICYQIFPDRFCRGEDWQQCQIRAKQPDGWHGPTRFVQQNWHDKPFYSYNSKGEVTRWGFFGGNLAGIASRLLYLKSLGVSAIYLNPIFQATSNHKYDTADYLHIDPSFGDEADFTHLAKAAERLGIRLILDGVFSHTGDDSRYFNKHGNYADIGAYQSETSPYHDWYKFQKFPDEYTSWWGVGALPEVHESNPEYQKFIFGDKNSVVRKWLRLGASGWRLDVADELPDFFIAGLAAAAKAEKPDALVLGEVWEDASNKQSYGEHRRYLFGDELDGVMNYPFKDGAQAWLLGQIGAEDLARRFVSQLENYPPEALACNLNLIGTHDTARILTVLGCGAAGLPHFDRGAAEEFALTPEQLAQGRQRLKLLSLLQFTMLGVPCIYYGDEAGAEGLTDPFNRGTYPWGRENEELLSWYRRLANLRQEYALLEEGDFWPLALAPEVYACRRFWSKKQQKAAEQPAWRDLTEEILVVCNRAEQPVSLELPVPEGAGWALELLSGREVVVAGEAGMLQTLPGLGCQVWLFCRRAPQQLLPERAAGVLCPLSSLPATEGGWPAAARRFVDYLAMAGQKLWQLLPLHPVGESNSPYTPYSVFAGQEQLAAEALALAGGRVAPQHLPAYEVFCREQAAWLEDWALFAAISEAPAQAGKPWQEWPELERDRKPADLPQLKKQYAAGMEAAKQRQFCFWQEWHKLRQYANEHGVSLIGDVPIYAGACSADVWADRELFLLQADGWPLAGAGVPPDYFAEDGQNWGHPLYDWPRHRADGFAWWKRRLALALQMYDYIRLDHFRSFSAFFAVPAGQTPKQGCWLKGPGREFFAELEHELGRLPIIAEDLGLLDQEVYNLLRLCGYPGMAVYQFEPERLTALAEADAVTASDDAKSFNRAVYSGTHDNQTLCGWLREKTLAEAAKAAEPDMAEPQAAGDGQTAALAEPEPELLAKQAKVVLQLLYRTPAPLVIVPLQDIFGLGDEARLNIPGQAQGNWRWRAEWQQFKITLAAELAGWVKQAKR